ncbi:uncharacterized protein CIMG_03741 [Coccidioides immitis RS]|uniref:Uncharacterized protein n=1 Tax=Coccidioides immitis (strain RS) TaxID=246410 RepID=J3KC08_COCIM|nr:uncharacterized protein CIMG_03741 [Coccidioides immitis RS]EAS32717.3 hypothetical protein CIMG_03741 [Coccidioides immitis RS]
MGCVNILCPPNIIVAVQNHATRRPELSINASKQDKLASTALILRISHLVNQHTLSNVQTIKMRDTVGIELAANYISDESLHMFS